MNESNSKIIRSFQSRLEIDTAVRSLGNTTSEAELQQLAKEIVEKYGEQATPALLALLNTTDPQLRGGLGHLAAMLPQENVVPVLRAAAYNRSLSDQARLTAITILENFLGIEPDQAMYDGMASPEELAVLSLKELLAETRADPMVVVEYMDQLSREPIDVQLAMVHGAQRLEGDERLELLRMFAQDPHVAVAQESLQGLGALIDAEAGQALHSLLPNLPPEMRVQGERALRKLRLRGIPIDEHTPPPVEGRCLASPPDGQDNQLLWFVLPASEKDTSQLLQVLITQQTGVTQASGSYAADNASLPAPAVVGTVHRAEQGAGPRGGLILEAPFDYGRRRVLQALEANWRAAAPTPLPYRLLNPLLWRWRRPGSAEKLQEASQAVQEGTTPLMQHPAMASWYLLTDEIYRVAEALMLSQEEVTVEQVEQATSTLAREAAADAEVVAGLYRSLESLREWLGLAGEPAAAEEAAAIAAALSKSPTESSLPASQALLTHMCLQGLRTAMVTLTLGVSLA